MLPLHRNGFTRIPLNGTARIHPPPISESALKLRESKHFSATLYVRSSLYLPIDDDKTRLLREQTRRVRENKTFHMCLVWPPHIVNNAFSSLWRFSFLAFHESFNHRQPADDKRFESVFHFVFLRILDRIRDQSGHTVRGENDVYTKPSRLRFVFLRHRAYSGPVAGPSAID